MLLLPSYTPETAALLNRVHCMDCFDLLRCIPDGSIDAIITDLPYGTTACSWDQIIPFAPMWAEVKRVLKPRGVFVTTASQPFTSALVMSNPAWFRYEWIWEKNFGSNFLNTDQYPMKEHENVLVFAEGAHCYNPQPTARNPNGAARVKYPMNPSNTGRRGFVDGFVDNVIRIGLDNSRVPRSLIYAVCERGQHPTQNHLACLNISSAPTPDRTRLFWTSFLAAAQPP